MENLRVKPAGAMPGQRAFVAEYDGPMGREKVILIGHTYGKPGNIDVLGKVGDEVVRSPIEQPERWGVEFDHAWAVRFMKQEQVPEFRENQEQ